jgi:hypothetical protein
MDRLKELVYADVCRDRALLDIQAHTGLALEIGLDGDWVEVYHWQGDMIHQFYIPGLSAYDAWKTFYWAWAEQAPCPF